MTRVLLVHQPSDGGVGRHLSDLAIGLTERGDEVVLCGPARPAALPERCTHMRLDLQRALAPRADSAALARLAKIVATTRPAIVHAHSSKAGAIARLDKLLHPRTAVLYTPHGYAFAGHFSRAGERLAYRAIESALTIATDLVVCVCEAEARLARMVGAGSKLAVVHNGIQPPADGPVDPRVVELAERGPVVCALTLLRPGKGLETLIDAAPRVLTRHAGVQFAIAGDGPDLESLRRRAYERGVADAFHFLGPSAEPLGMLRGAAVFVHPSWAESFPYAVLEAMSVGLPVVASAVGGIPEAIVDGDSGLLVAPRDEQALAEALVRLLENPTLRAALGDSAERRLKQRFSRTAMIDGLSAAYARALDGRARSAR